MDKTDEAPLTQTRLKELVKEGKIPAHLAKYGLIELEKCLKKIIDFQLLKTKGASKEEISNFFIESGETQEDFEKGLAAYKFLIDNKDTLKKIIGSEDKKRPSKFRQSGHLIDQSLKFNDPKKAQLDIWDKINSETKIKIQQAKIEVKAQGIRLSPSEDKLLKAINKLLYEKSENKDENSEYFYSGNEPAQELIPYGGRGQTAKAALLRIGAAELYKCYLDKNDYSGEEIKFIKKTLYDLAAKKFLIVYDRKRIENGRQVTDRVEDFQPLIKILNYMEGLSDTDLKRLENGDAEIREKKGEMLIGLNPIFIDQINTKYIEYPSDINRRTTIAAGGHNYITESMIVLRDYMLREISSKRFEVEINEEKLPFILRLDNYVKSYRKKLIATRIEGAIDCVKNLGIIIDYKRVKGAEGQTKYIFTLNKTFE